METSKKTSLLSRAGRYIATPLKSGKQRIFSWFTEKEPAKYRKYCRAFVEDDIERRSQFDKFVDERKAKEKPRFTWPKSPFKKQKQQQEGGAKRRKSPRKKSPRKSARKSAHRR